MKKNKAFTLLELLVVIAVLAGFMALLIPNYMQVRTKSRDGRRKTDLRAIQKALELYKINQTTPIYPNSPLTTCGAIADASGTYMQKVPQDPSTQCGATQKAYYYQRGADTATYILAACLETANDPEGIVCPAGYACTSTKCYQLTEP